MAQLSGGTTIAGYEAIHEGNLDEKNIATKGFGGAGENIKVLVGQDLNTIQTTGNYLAENCTNSPETGWGFLTVCSYNDGSSSTRIFQIYKHDITTKIYYRHYSSSWSTWVNIANFSDIPTKTSQITNDGNGTSNFVTADQLGNAGYGDMTKAQYDTNSNGVVDKAEKLATARNIALTGDVTGNVNFDGASNASIATTLKNSGVNAGTYRNVTVDAQGRVTSGTNPTTRDGYGLSDVPTKDEVNLSIDNIEIGGRNLARYTGSFNSIFNTSNYLNQGGISISKLDNDTIEFKSTLVGTISHFGFYLPDNCLIPEENYTLKCMYRYSGSSNALTLQIGNRTTIDTGLVTESLISDNNWHEMLYSNKVNSNSSNKTNLAIWTSTSELAVGDILDFKFLKFEKGNKATDWTPAPEDTQSQIDNINTTIGSTTLSTNDKTVKGAINEVKENIPRITQDTSTQPTNQSTGGVWLKPV